MYLTTFLPSLPPSPPSAFGTLTPPSAPLLTPVNVYLRTLSVLHALAPHAPVHHAVGLAQHAVEPARVLRELAAVLRAVRLRLLAQPVSHPLPPFPSILLPIRPGEDAAGLVAFLPEPLEEAVALRTRAHPVPVGRVALPLSAVLPTIFVLVYDTSGRHFAGTRNAFRSQSWESQWMIMFSSGRDNAPPGAGPYQPRFVAFLIRCA